jgi:hypothetical protein
MGSVVIQSGAQTPWYSMFKQQKGSRYLCDTLYSNKVQYLHCLLLCRVSCVLDTSLLIWRNTSEERRRRISWGQFELAIDRCRWYSPASPWPESAAPGPGWTCKVGGGWKGGGVATDEFWYFHIPTDEVQSILLDGGSFILEWEQWKRCGALWACHSLHVGTNWEMEGIVYSGSESSCHFQNLYVFTFLFQVIILYLDSWTEHFSTFVVKEPTVASRQEYDLLVHSKFYPFQQVIAIIRVSYLP